MVSASSWSTYPDTDKEFSIMMTIHSVLAASGMWWANGLVTVRRSILMC